MKIKSTAGIEVLYDSVLAVFAKPSAKKDDGDDFVKKDGLYIPKNSSLVEKEEKEPLIIGRVVAVGTGYFNSRDESLSVSLRVKPGDIIVIDSRNAANNLIFPYCNDDQNFEFRLLREQNVLMIVKNIDETFELAKETNIISKDIVVDNKEEATNE